MRNRLKNPDLILRAESLLAVMSLEQKIGQMTQADRMTCSPEDVREYHLGSVMSGAGSAPGANQPKDWVEMNDAYWIASMQSDGTGPAIPILYGLDAVHGNNNVAGATIFPHNIGLGASGDTELLARVAEVTAKEILATGLDWAFAPNLAIAQNTHWGRSYESYGQNPETVARCASAIVKALQSDKDNQSVLACIKHWVGDGGTKHGIDQGDNQLEWTELKSTHIRPFRSAIKAGAAAVMASFSSWKGDKCHANKFLLTDVLKGEMDFNGFVLSDMQGIDYVSEDFYQAVAKSVNAGIDMFMVPENWKLFIEHLMNHVEYGTVPIERINNAVKRILLVKLSYGLFEKPRPKERQWANHASFGSKEHREVAREAVRKSLVLLKNQQDILPLSKDARILVAGKNANNRAHQCGGFTLSWQGDSGNAQIMGGTSIWEAIRLANRNAVLSKSDTAEDADNTAHDVAVVVIGETPYAEGHGDIRDNDDIIFEVCSTVKGQMRVTDPLGHSLELEKLYPEDLQTIENITAKGIPVVVVLVSGRPLVTNSEIDKASAFVAAWLPGSEGQGVTDVLFGDYNFEGRLSFNWPKVCDPSAPPLFPIGYGLDYKKPEQNKRKRDRFGKSRLARLVPKFNQRPEIKIEQ